MANELLLVNPRRRRRKTRSASPVRRRRTTRARRRNPVGPFARRRSGLSMYVANPRRRRRRSAVARTVRRMRIRRRNPTGGRMTIRSVMNNLVVPAAQAATGAVALDVIYGFLPIPEQWKMGPMRHAVKGVSAIVLGQLVGTMLNRRIGNNVAMGALTVSFHDAIRELVGTMMPQIPLGYYSAGADAGYDPSLGYYVGSPALATSRGESVPAADSELGYYVQEGAGAQY